jgi:histidine triad (HIT) family protein
MSEKCVFCQIINKEKQAYIIYEDDLCIAFLDSFPVNEGHTLVVPRKHYENIYDIPENTLAHIMKVSKKLALDYQKIFQSIGLNIIQSNGSAAKQTVFHFHLHLIPRYENDGLALFRHHFARTGYNLEDTYQKIAKLKKK